MNKSDNSRRYIYDLLNPQDEFTIIFLINEVASIDVFAKHSGLSVKQVSTTTRREPLDAYYSSILSMIGAIMGAIVTMIVTSTIWYKPILQFLQYIRQRRKKKESENP